MRNLRTAVRGKSVMVEEYFGEVPVMELEV
jgi:hypothetical protein